MTTPIATTEPAPPGWGVKVVRIESHQDADGCWTCRYYFEAFPGEPTTISVTGDLRDLE
jgi:hypothetical protein